MALALLLPGCALIDGLSGGDCDTPSGSCDEGDTCDFTHDLGTVPIDESDLDNCGRRHDFELGLCRPATFGEDVVFQFEVLNPGMHTICGSATFGSDFFVSEDCNFSPSVLQCLDFDGGCVDVFLSGGPKFVFWQSAFPDDCSFVSLQVFEAGGGGSETGPLQCLDGIDNDFDGRQDCEDPDCAPESACDAFVDCDGAGPEGSCRCVDDGGCDDTVQGFRCHFDATPQSGVCGPDCNLFDWCPNFGLLCGPNGLCENGPMPVSADVFAHPDDGSVCR